MKRDHENGKQYSQKKKKKGFWEAIYNDASNAKFETVGKLTKSIAGKIMNVKKSILIYNNLFRKFRSCY